MDRAACRSSCFPYVTNLYGQPWELLRLREHYKFEGSQAFPSVQQSKRSQTPPLSQLPMRVHFFSSQLVCKIPGSELVTRYSVAVTIVDGKLSEYASPFIVYRTLGSNLSCDHREFQVNKLTLTSFRLVDKEKLDKLRQNAVDIRLLGKTTKRNKQLQEIVELLIAANVPEKVQAAWAPFKRDQLRADGILVFVEVDHEDGVALLSGVALQSFPEHLGIKLELVE